MSILRTYDPREIRESSLLAARRGIKTRGASRRELADCTTHRDVTLKCMIVGFLREA